MKKRIFSALITFCMVLALLPVGALAAGDLATAVTVGGVVLNGSNPYATTNTDGTVTSEGATEANYNVKFDAPTGTLTLRNANINSSGYAISSENILNVVAKGTNMVSASGVYQTIYLSSGPLRFKGDGALTVVSNQGTAVDASNITVRESITLTAVGGTAPNYPGGDGLYATYNIEIKDFACVTAIGGACNKVLIPGSPGITGIWGGASVTIGGTATVNAIGGDTTAGGYSAGISTYENGAISIEDNAKVLAVGGNAGTNASYGLYANGASGSITRTGGLLVAKGGKGSTSLAMNKVATGGGLTSAAVINNDGSSKYCVVSPKTDGSADYHVVVGSVSGSTGDVDDHIAWGGGDLTLRNTIVIAPDGNLGANTALHMPENTSLNLEGFNVLLAGDSTSGGDSIALEGGIVSSNLTVSGSGDLTAISGSADQCYGIVNAAQISSTGTVTAIGGSGYYSYGIYGPASIFDGTVIAVGGESGGSNHSYGIFKEDSTLTLSGSSGVAIGKTSAFKAAPDITGLAALGVWNSKAMVWGAMPSPAVLSTTPAADVTEVTKALSIQTSVTFALTIYPAGTYNVYADGSTASVHGTVTAGLSGNTLTLTHATDIPAGTYYVSVTEADKTESARLALTVGAYVPPDTCHLTVNLNGGSGGTTSGDYAPGASVPIDAGTRAGYSFSGWTASLGSNPFADASSPSTTFTMPPNPATITANWSYTGGSSGGGGGAAVSKYEAKVVSGGSSGKTDVTVDTKKGSASAKLSAKDLKNDTDFVVTMPTVSGVTNYDLGLPVARLVSDSEDGSIRLNTDVGSITLPANMLTGSDAVSGNTAHINIGTVDSSALADIPGAAVSNRPIVTLSLSIDGKPADWSNPGAPVTVSIPYTPTKGEDQNAIVIWYIDGTGNLNCVTNGRYDPKTGSVVFQTTHFSLYAVGYNNVVFTDVADGAWHHSAVTYLAARGITFGTTNKTFSPDAALTRGQFITMLLRAYGVAAVENPTDNFADAGSAYYTSYLAAAKGLGISNGVGDNRFAPEQAITRQEMFTLLYKTLKVLNKLPEGGSGKTLGDFADSGSVASWAKEAMTVLVSSGIVSGSDGKLSPASGSNRGQMAQVLYNLLNK